MNLYRIKLRPLSAWRTPWHSDTLSGMLCWSAARWLGPQVLRDEILEPALAGSPPFVLSDAFPSDLLPVPAVLRTRMWPVQMRKLVKKARWMRAADFDIVRNGGGATPEMLIPDVAFRRDNHLHVMLDRSTDQSSDGALFTEVDMRMDTRAVAGLSEHLTVYARVVGGFETRLMQLFRLLCLEGFGADKSSGFGQVSVLSDLEPQPGLDDCRASGIVVLSTFQPAEGDPTDGAWELLAKYGKLGPDYGVDSVFKRPLVMLRPGACFACSAPAPFVGRAVRANDMLEQGNAMELAAEGIEPIQYAFGLAVPLQILEDD